MKQRFCTASEEETLLAAEKFASHLKEGDIVLLKGDLGAGKTVFARGVARALGIDAPVKSPTFTIVREYRGRCKLNHFDLYRITDPDELYEIGWEEYLSEGICVIEWPQIAEALLPEEVITVDIQYAGKNKREIQITC